MINILYCTDDRLFNQLIISLISLAKTTREVLNVINLTEELPEYNPAGRKTSAEQDALCEAVLREANPLSVFRSFDVSDLVREHLLTGPNIRNRFYKFSAYVSVRLLAHLVPEIPDKILYVDSDVLFPGDVKELYGLDVSGVELAGRRDAYKVTKYIQSGVMLLNMKKIREAGTFDRALKLVQTRKYACYIDMSALNAACKSKMLLPKKYNSYRWTKDALVHHVCSMRGGRVPFTPKWRHRIKTDEFGAAERRLPQYRDIYKKFEEIRNTYPERRKVWKSEAESLYESA